MTDSEQYDRAKKRLHNGTTNEVNRAQAEATLALAYEQRTANLIALMQTGNYKDHEGSEWGIMLELREDLFNEAASRLGLPETFKMEQP